MQIVTVIKGNGIGPEVTESVLEMVEATGADVGWDFVKAGQEALIESGIPIPQQVYRSIEEHKVILKGPLTTPIGKGFRSINLEIRRKYDMYANIRPVKNIGSVPTKFSKVDLIIFRENTEDVYGGLEEQISEDETRSIKVTTRKASQRIAVKAFEYAKEKGLRKVTVVTKANIMKLTDGLFLEAARQVAEGYSGIELEEMLMDNMCMQLVLDPTRYQVILTTNLYGDIMSELCAGLVGGLGLVPSAIIGEEYALFEAVHGTAPDIAGRNIANPTGLALSAAMMLDYIGEKEAAETLNNALHEVLRHPENYTKEIGGNLSTTEFTEKVIEEIQRQL